MTKQVKYVYIESMYMYMYKGLKTGSTQCSVFKKNCGICHAVTHPNIYPSILGTTLKWQYHQSDVRDRSAGMRRIDCMFILHIYMNINTK